jgi:sugar-specific transcriptional regulator TrmB
MQLQDIDKLTLELLTNKSQYKKYLSKADPEKYKSNQEHLEKISKYRGKIMDVFSQLLEDPDKQITTSLNDDFDHFVKSCISHFEMKEMENRGNHFEKEEEEDDDIMFGNCDEKDELIESDIPKSKSFWGKSIIKTGQPPLPIGYTMDHFLKSSKR